MGFPSWWLAVVDRFAGFSTVETRVAVTAAIVIIAFVGGWYVFPKLVRVVRLGLQKTVVRGVVKAWVANVSKILPWWVSESLLVSIVQISLLVGAGFSILLVWGQVDLVVSIVSAASISVPVLGQVGITVGLIIAAWVAIDVLETWLDHLTDRSEQFSKHQEEIAFRVLQIVLISAVGLAALTLWGVDLGGLLVGAGFLGIVVGMAARQTLGSLIAGFVLMFSRPFEIGDWVEIGQQEGIVTDITIVNTRLENFDGEFVVLPNDMVSNSTILNRSKKGRLRLRVEVGIDYEADPERAQEIAVDALSDLDEILTVPRPVAITSRLGDSSVVLQLRFWIDKPSARRRAKATSAAIRAVKQAFDEEGIKIPYPQRELMGREEAGGFRVVDDGS